MTTTVVIKVPDGVDYRVRVCQISRYFTAPFGSDPRSTHVGDANSVGGSIQYVMPGKELIVYCTNTSEVSVTEVPL